MDQAFLLRAKRLLDERQRDRLDYARLAAETNARQANSPTARAAAALNETAATGDDALAAVTVILSENGWSRAVRIQAGCFSRAAARRRVNIV